MPQWLRTTLRLAAVVLVAAVGEHRGLAVSRNVVDYESLRQSSDSLGTFVQTLGGIYAVLLAFVVIVVWGQFNEARSYVDREANALVDLHRTASGLPAHSRTIIQRGLRDYVDAVLNDEWEAMASRDQATIDRIGHALDRRVDGDPQRACRRTSASTRCYSEVLCRFNDLTEHRTNRLTRPAARFRSR